MPRLTCPSRAELTAFLDGELPDADLLAIGSHMEGCPECDRAAEILDDRSDPVAALLRSVESDATPLGGRPAPARPVGTAAPARLGGYEVVRELGRGGMGVVYKGWDPALKRSVALKVIRAGEFADAEASVRFRREAEAVARVRHPGLVQIYGVGRHDGLPFLALEYVPGGSLDDHLAGVPQPAASAARLVAVLADAVQAVHDGGVVHRDLKPSNVLLVRPPTADEWFVKVTDFGLAKCLDGSPALTADGTAAGTPSYMAPEQAVGRPGGVGRPADVYALGAILYEVLVGHPPFQAETARDTLAQVVHEAPVPPSRLRPRVPRDLETVCLKCLEKNPRHRYATARELAADLRRFLADVPVTARRAGPTERFARACRRNPLPTALVGLIGLSLVAGTTAATTFAVRANRSAEEAKANEARAVGETRAADAAREDLRRNLYTSQVQLAGQAAYLNRSWPQIDALLAPWRPSPVRADRPGWEWHYLDSLGKRELLRLPHDESILHFVWNPAGTRVAVLDRRNEAEIWDVKPAPAARVKLPAGTVAHCAAWSPDGTRLAVGGHVGGVQVWRAADGVLLRTLPTELGVLTVSWSRDGRRVAAITPGAAEVTVWNPDTGETEPGLPIGPNRAYQFALSPDWSRVAAVSPGRIDIVDLTGGRPPVVVNEGTMVLEWSPDGRRLAAALAPDRIALLDPDTGRTVASARGLQARATSLGWSPDGKALCSVSTDAVVCVLNAADATLSHTYLGHTGPLFAVAWSPTGDRIISAGVDKEARVWPARRPAAEVAGGAAGLSWSADSTRLAVVGKSGGVHVIDRATLREPGPSVGYPANAVTAAWSPGADRIACGGKDGVVRVMDADTGRVAFQLGDAGGPVTSLAWDRSGGRLAVGRAGAGVHVWDVEQRRVIGVPVADGPDVRVMAWGADGSLAAGVGDEVWVWDGAGVKSVFVLPAADDGQRDVVFRLAWNPAGTGLAAGGTLGRVAVWARGEMRPRLVLPVAPDAALCGLAWSPDGRRIAATAFGTGVRFWDAATGSPAFSLDADAGVSDLAWSRDGTALAGVTRGTGFVPVWDAAASYGHHVPRDGPTIPAGAVSQTGR